MKQENLEKIDKSIELLKEVYETELMNGGKRHDFRLTSLLEIIKKSCILEEKMQPIN